MNSTPKLRFVGVQDKESCIKNADDLRDAMSHIQPIDHDFSVKIGMAVNDEFGEEARDIWIDWALGREKATRAKVTSSWNSFKRSRGITIATVVAEAKASGWQPNCRQIAPFTPEQMAERETRKAQLITQAAAEAKQKTIDTKKAAEKAEKEWFGANTPDHGHPYVKTKQIKPYGARQLKDGRLIIPLRNKAGEICSSQTINSDGVKKYEKSGVKAGSHSPIGEFEGADTVLLCEGWATGCSLHEATGYPVVVCLDSGNLAKISKNLPNVISPLARLVICGDRDESEAGQKAAASALNGLTQMGRHAVVFLPVFSGANASLTDFNDLAASEGIDTVKQQINAAIAKPTALEPVPEEELIQTETAEEQENVFPSFEANDFVTAFPPQPWLIKGVLPSKGIAAIFGASSSGKSFLALDMACAIAEDPDGFYNNHEWFGHKVKHEKVAIAVLEGVDGFGNRLAAWSKSRGKPLPKNLVIIPIGSGFDIRSYPDQMKLARSTKGAKVLFVDTLAQSAAGADENSSVDMGNMLAGLKSVQESIDGLVVAIHHAGKDPSRGMRGHSSLRAGLDAVIEVSRTNSERSWKVEKAKDGIDRVENPFKLDIVELGEDEDGDTITSCVCLPDDSPKIITPKYPSSGHNLVVYKTLSQMLYDDRFAMKHLDGMPSDRPAVNFDDLVQACKESLLAPEREDGSDPLKRVQDVKNTVKRAVEKLTKDRVISHNSHKMVFLLDPRQLEDNSHKIKKS